MEYSQLSDNAKEIVLFIENSAECERMLEPYLKNIYRKIKNKSYSHEMAPKLWMYYVDNCRKTQDFISQYGSWKVPVSARREAAQYFSEYYYDEVVRGNYNNLLGIHHEDTLSAAALDIEVELDHHLRTAGYNPDEIRMAIGEQWVANVVSRVVEEIVNRPQIFQNIVDGILDRVKQRL